MAPDSAPQGGPERYRPPCALRAHTMCEVLPAVGFDPASGSPVRGLGGTSSSWHMYLNAIYDPTLDDVEAKAEPEICSILQGSDEASLRHPKDASSKRFAVCGANLLANCVLPMGSVVSHA